MGFTYQYVCLRMRLFSSIQERLLSVLIPFPASTTAGGKSGRKRRKKRRRRRRISNRSGLEMCLSACMAERLLDGKFRGTSKAQKLTGSGATASLQPGKLFPLSFLFFISFLFTKEPNPHLDARKLICAHKLSRNMTEQQQFGLFF